MADICVRRVETATDEQLQQMTAALVAAFDGGTRWFHPASRTVVLTRRR
jgi:hypothetical protein